MDIDNEGNRLLDDTLDSLFDGESDGGVNEGNSNESSDIGSDDLLNGLSVDDPSDQSNINGQNDTKATTGDEQELEDADDNAESNSEESQKTDGQRSTEKSEGDLPEALRPHKTLLENKGWSNISDEGTIAKIVESYAEAEKTLGDRNQETSVLRAGAQDIRNVMFGEDIAEINKIRESQGLSPFETGQSIEEQRKEYDSLVQNLNQLQSEDLNVRTSAWNSLNEQLKNKGTSLLKAEWASENKSKNSVSQQQAIENARANIINFQSQAKDPSESMKDLEAVTSSHLGDLLSSFGIGTKQMASDPARLKGFAQIGALIRKGQDFDQALSKGIEEGVQAKLKAINSKSNAAPVGVDSVSGNNNQQAEAPNDDIFSSLLAEGTGRTINGGSW